MGKQIFNRRMQIATVNGFANLVSPSQSNNGDVQLYHIQTISKTALSDNLEVFSRTEFCFWPSLVVCCEVWATKRYIP